MYKGSDIATFLDDTSVMIRFFNPRTDTWYDHFHIENTGQIISKTPIGSATIKIFKLNHVDSMIERAEMIRMGIF